MFLLFCRSNLELLKNALYTAVLFTIDSNAIGTHRAHLQPDMASPNCYG